jgi:XTP/dITP diphosphohydrolase
MVPVLVATRNQHKVREIQTILGGTCRCMTLRDLDGAPEIPETATTFAGNASLKAEGLAAWLALKRSSFPQFAGDDDIMIIADDSGLEVDALDGAPGVYSARFAAVASTDGNSPDADNNAKLLRLLKDVPEDRRTARFRCVIALVELRADGQTSPARFFEGSCEGRMGCKPRGHNGFGYDPLFTPDGFSKTFAELGDDVKNRISHRSRALAELKRGLGTTSI